MGNSVRFKEGHLYRFSSDSSLWHDKILLFMGSMDFKLIFRVVMSNDFKLSKDYAVFNESIADGFDPSSSGSHGNLWWAAHYSKEIPLEDIPLYCGWNFKYPALMELIKE